MSKTLATLTDTSRKPKSRKRVGRGVGSGLGKTSGRGQKGAGARSGYKRRHTYEGGQARLFEKMPTRGFSRARFQKRLDVVNLGLLETLFQDGDEVSIQTLKEKGLLSGPTYGLKVLGDGEFSRKLTIKAQAMSASAKAKAEAAGSKIVLPEGK